ncbi:vacuolar protein-sorting protein Bro1p [[Candida] railenensis]|uniref:BRO domain-containing protein 1 n=1 Tax=[Candida] railenensis TaxID=45579 RepID=A0A9P0QT15_9ASCO|nr:vacuolar protein-sorting protein Bro1p [[Candida] railenensis]
MKTSLLSIPSKKTEDVNWTKPINNYLLSIYGNTSEYQQDLATFNSLRQDIKGGLNADVNGLKIYYKYYSLLELLDLRVPFATLNKHKKISFTWFDSFQPKLSYKQYALPFEKASILFNIGSLISEIALKKYGDSSMDDDSYKEILLLLQQAAGIFQFLGENFLHAPSNDLNQATIKFLIQLMLAQSQELFVLKVISGDMEQKKNSLISKLCKGTASYYEECFKMVSHLKSKVGDGGLEENYDEEDEEDEEDEGNGYEVRDTALDDFEYDPDANIGDDSTAEGEKIIKINSNWISIIEFKKIYYSSLSLYFHGLQCEAGKKFGDAIAYLSKSLDILNEIHSSTLKSISKSRSSSVYELLDNYKYQKDAIGIKIAELEKDNDFIYHDIIPSKVTLPEIKAMDGVKLIPITKNVIFNEINEYNYSNFFTNVVPITIHELMSFYSEEKSQFLRNELDLFDVSNEELSSVMEYLKMPKSLVNLKEIIQSDSNIGKNASELTIPPSIIKLAQEISNSYSNDLSNKSQIQKIRDEIYSIIQNSESNSSEHKEDLLKLKKSFIEASNRDKGIFELIKSDDMALYNTLGKGTDSKDFKQLFSPHSGNVKTGAEDMSLLDIDDRNVPSDTLIKNKIHDLEEILHDLHTIKVNKGKIIDSLKSEIHNDDISDILILNTKVKSTNEIKNVIFPEELRKFERYSKELDSLVSKQKIISESLVTKWTQLSQDSKVKDIQSSSKFQEELLKDQESRINALYGNWKRYTTGLSKGVEFYNSLLAYAKDLSKKIKDKHEEVQLEQSFGGMNIHPKYGPSNPGFSQNTGPQASQNTGYSQSSGYHSAQNTGYASNVGSNSGYQQQVQQPQHSGYSSSTSQHQGYSQQPQIYGQQPVLQNTYSDQSAYNRPSYPISNSSYTNAPSLPPKTPHHPQRPQQQYQQPQQHQQPGPTSTGKPNSESDLIYDQPSTYQPNMYNFFSSNQ